MSDQQLTMNDLVAIPGSIESALNMAKAVSHWMFGLYFVGICFSVVSFVVGESVPGLFQECDALWAMHQVG